ncbi:MAG TPA: hypothetical protein VFI34_00615 [Candidatus Limnocylindrales bacterium]|nr:hypothetical protein [Candidatus Limnocylindrales bacterium]
MPDDEPRRESTTEPAPPGGDAAEPEGGRLARVGELLEGAVDAVRDRASSVVGTTVDLAQDAARRWDERPGARVRRVRRLGSAPLPYLLDVHPDARRASPRELGLKTIGLDEIAGTAVGGAVQRGADFLPLKPFRSLNWTARWQRLRQAGDRLAILPPIDVRRFADRYWVEDGHNRVALGLYTGQVGIDANVVELVPPGARPSERSGALAAVLTGSRALRAAGEGRRQSEFEDADRPDRHEEP